MSGISRTYVWSNGKWIKKPLTPATNPAETYGWVNGAWQKNPIALGYSRLQGEANNDTGHGGGSVIYSETQVPAGEIWVLESAGVKIDSEIVDDVQIKIFSAGVIVWVLAEFSPAADEWDLWNGSLVMEEDDFVQFVITGITALKEVHTFYRATVTDIDQ